MVKHLVRISHRGRRHAAALLVFAAASTSAPALADEATSIVATIRPLHSLVAGVTDGVTVPYLIVPGAGSPHAYTLRPSDAAALEQAQVIFWIGEDMETFLAEPLETLGEGAVVVALADAPGVTRLAFRDSGPFVPRHHGTEEDHAHADHDHGGHDHDEHGHDHHAHADHDEGGHEEHGHEEHGHDHRHGAIDMHMWLDPANARAWTAVIVDTLVAADPANAAAYAANGDAVAARLDDLTAELEATLAPVRDRPFVVFHDAYQYMENRFDLTVAGSITVGPDIQPGADRVAEIQHRVRDLGVVCIFSEPQFAPRFIDVIAEGGEVGTGVLDPLGADLEDGPDLYFELMRQNAGALADCLN